MFGWLLSAGLLFSEGTELGLIHGGVSGMVALNIIIVLI